MAQRAVPAVGAIERFELGDGAHRRVEVAFWDEATGHAIHHDLAQPAARIADDGCARGLRLAGDEAKRLVPVNRAEDGGSASHQLPEAFAI